MAAAPVPAYAREVYSGQRQYLLETPVVPGSRGVGRAEDTTFALEDINQAVDHAADNAQPFGMTVIRKAGGG